MTLSIATWTARRLTQPQRVAVRVLAEGRVQTVALATMAVLIRLELVELVDDAPMLAQFGLDVAAELAAATSAP